VVWGVQQDGPVWRLNSTTGHAVVELSAGDEGEMVATFCTSGEKEGLKGGVHAAACGLAVIMTVYNSAAWWYRRERHLSINAVVYATAAAWEIVQVRRHWSRLAAMQRVCSPSESSRELDATSHQAA
jgi:hypothetical protein